MHFRLCVWTEMAESTGGGRTAAAGRRLSGRPYEGQAERRDGWRDEGGARTDGEGLWW